VTWNREEIEKTLDRRTVISREVHRVMDLAEEEMANLHLYYAAELESERKGRVAEMVLASEEQKKIDQERAELIKVAALWKERMQLLTQRTVVDGKLSIELTHPGQEYDDYTGCASGPRWWPLAELEEVLTNLRMQGADDKTQVMVDDENLKVDIPDIGFMPIAKPKTVVVVRKSPVNVVAVVMTILFALAFIISLVVS